MVWAFLLNFLIALVEIAGGLVSSSLSLVSDALHNIGDAASILLAWMAHRIGKRPSTARKTFGYKRVEILAALLNGVILMGTTIFLIYQAIRRLSEPMEINGPVMLTVAVIGLAANVVAAIILHRDSGHNLNVKAAYLHLLSDTLSSVAVILGALLIIFLDIYWVDTLITFIISIYILYQAWKIIRQTTDILMQSTPQGINLQEIRKELESLKGISNIHHIHAWNLDDHAIHFECHVELERDIRLSEVESIHHAVHELLEERYHIHHITIQFEHDWCHDRGPLIDQ